MGFLCRNTGVANNVEASLTSAEKYWLNRCIPQRTSHTARPSHSTAVYTE
jgi:hypothetical protein